MQLAEMYPSRYLGAADVKARNGLIIDTIEHVTMEEMQSNRGGKQMKPVAYLRSNKPMVLNKTNGTRLGQWLGDNTDHWIGARVKIGVEQVQSIGGGLTEGIRVQAAQHVPTPVVANPAPMPPAPQPAPAAAPAPVAPAVAREFDDDIPF
jgi:hypothetical protein